MLYWKKHIRLSIKRLISIFWWDEWAVQSWSQESEDLILSRIFGPEYKGFYVDVGAHHPRRFSNTNLFYRRGWHGINIDANPKFLKAFNLERKRDININVGVGQKEGFLTYFSFNEPALNTFSEELAKLREENSPDYRIVETLKIEVLPLRTILETNLPPDQNIDFISVDVEGLDEEVLCSNDWEKFRPRVVVFEILEADLAEIQQLPVVKMLQSYGYTFYAKCAKSVFFIVNKSEENSK